MAISVRLRICIKIDVTGLWSITFIILGKRVVMFTVSNVYLPDEFLLTVDMFC